MPFLPPNQQHQSTEGKKPDTETKKNLLEDNASFSFAGTL